jgi:RNA polymerase sigma-70 factor, ECF subfamily
MTTTTAPAEPATTTTHAPQRAATEVTIELVSRAQGGDRAALDELLVRCLPTLRRWAHGRLPSAARGPLDTEDLVQQAAFQTLKRLHLFQPRHVYSLQAYLKEAIVNRIRDTVRRQVRVGTPEELPEERHDEKAVSPLEEVLRQETVERYRAGLAKLRPGDRRAAILRLELELSYEELAHQLGKPTAGAACVATRRAIGRLAKILGHDSAAAVPARA